MICRPIGVSRSWRKCLFQFAFASYECREQLLPAATYRKAGQCHGVRIRSSRSAEPSGCSTATPLEGTFAPRNDPSTLEYVALHEQMTFPQTELVAMLRETLHDHDQLLLHVSAYPPAAAMLSAMQADGRSASVGQTASPVRARRQPDAGFDSTGEGDGNRGGAEPDSSRRRQCASCYR